MLAIGTLWLVGGLVYPVLSLASEDFSAIEVTAVRAIGAVIMTTPLLLYRLRGALHRLWSWRILWPNLVAALLFYPIGNGLLTYASGRLQSSLTPLVFALLPVLAAAVSAGRGVRLGRATWIGVTGAFFSLIVVVGAPGSNVPLIPVFAAMASVVCWYTGTELWASRNVDIDLIASVWIQLVIGAVACWVILIASGSQLPPLDRTVQPIMLFLAFSQFIQHAAYLGIAGRVSPLLLTSFAFVHPVVAAIAGYFLLHQRLTAVQIVGSVALLFAVSLVVRASQAGKAVPSD